MKLVNNVKKVVALFSAITTLSVASVNAFSVNAASGSKSKSIKNSRATTKYTASLYYKENFWDIELHADGSASTIWHGTNPYNADSIVHNNILSCTGIGSMSIGGSKSGPTFSASVSGHTATWTYTLQNTWKVETTFNYYTTGLLAGWSPKMRTSATVQLGSNFYTFGT